MKSRLQNVGILVAVTFMLAALWLTPVLGADKPQTLSGQVSDAMCGAKHMMSDPAQCTHACVEKGSKYALVVGDKVYTLETSDKAALETLAKMAGQKATVTGTVEGQTVQVNSVSAH